MFAAKCNIFLNLHCREKIGGNKKYNFIVFMFSSYRYYHIFCGMFIIIHQVFISIELLTYSKL